MAPSASIIVPTRDRPDYLEVALGSIAPQAAALGAELIVADDGPSEATRALAQRHRARHVTHPSLHGPNAARNAGIEAAGAELLVFVDDDVEAPAGWLQALLAAHQALPADYAVLAGRIRARIEDHAFHACGREGPPISFLDLGDADTDTAYGWGANMAVRRAWLERVGAFDPHHQHYGDEEEWGDRLRAAGGRVRYVAAAAVWHRRAGDDARLGRLARAAYHRGRASRRYDVSKGPAPRLETELRTLLGSAIHGPRRLCMNGPVMAAHSAGRVREALWPQAPAPAHDFVSGRSGHVAGRRGQLRRIADRALDAFDAISGRRARLATAGAASPPRRVLAIGAHYAGRPSTTAQTVAALRASHHDVTVDIRPPTGGKFESLNAIVADHDLAGFDWVLVIDDDVELAPAFLDGFLLLAERFGLDLAQPAQSLASHAAWPITRRRPAGAVRETTFVEIGPVTAFGRRAAAALIPFPDLRMGWGLELHWAAVAREQGWRMGVVDLTPVRHELRAVSSAYPREEAIEEARAFLADRPYLRRDDVRTLAVHRRW